MRFARRLTLCVALAFVAATIALAGAAETAKAKPAELKVSGYGFWGNRMLKRTLRTMDLAPAQAETVDAAFVEDAAFIILARVRRDGFLSPRVSVELEAVDGENLRVEAEELVADPLPRPLALRKVHFRIRKGPLYHYRSLRFEGLAAIPEKKALAYFVETGAFFTLKNGRIFTPERLRRSLLNLADALDTLGYREVVVSNLPPQLHERTGDVDVTVVVREGTQYIVRSVTEEFAGDPAPRSPRVFRPEKPYSRLWTQEFSQQLRTNLYARGYPDATVSFETLRQAPAVPSGSVEVDLLARLEPGPLIIVGDVVLKGHQHTQTGFIRRRIRAERGELLDPIRLERSRFRLAELGAFDSVGLDYEPVDEHTRDVVFQFDESKRFNLSVLLGWGSYEMLRGGFEGNFNNIWRRAHRAQLRVVQSLKSSSGDFSYTVPDLTHRNIDLFVNGFALRREEVTWTREEFGGGLGAHKFFRRYATDASIRYNYQVLNAASVVPAVESEGLISPDVGAIIGEIRYDRRDNPLYPRKGTKLFLTVETAHEELMGDADYERIEASGSWHFPLRAGTWASFGVSHSVAVSQGPPAENLPFNKRIFPGGANSIRGFQDGEASPRNEQGQIVGAESALLGTFELEQALTTRFSLVGFIDALGIARRLDDYPFDETLFSVGGGLRWRTIIGPVRLEYGHNLNPRRRDPSGTIQFSIGYPF